MTGLTQTEATTGQTVDDVAVDVRGLTITFTAAGKTITPIDGLDLQVRRGELVCILGPSGQGKSTLLRAVAGLTRPDAGSITTPEGAVTEPGAERGMVFQQDAIPMWLRVQDNVAFGPKLRGVPRAEYQPTVDHLIEEVGLDEWRRAWPRQLSGGMRKRVAIAAVFANEPSILLMDEPFGALDFFTREKLQGLLLQLWAETAKTVLFVTHDVDEALLLADRIVILGKGRVAQDITVPFARPRGDDLRSDPAAIELRQELIGRLGEK
ncbi:ABC transporter ATP-binding protein [Amycolatopsis sp. GM8]|uniref:ABC transporter ATP-binding protein n=1 Tax=Amycolatopsis sp. GM8 TaxID=2896530 RepID=UPI001F2FD020|nr:ABC transporter ATP-binding protein [Amycolatopsis sp. GM8]